MTATIKVHAQSRGGWWAEAKMLGRNVCVAGITLEQAVQACAMRIVGCPTPVPRDGSFDLMAENDIRLRHLRSERDAQGYDEEVYEMEAMD